MTYCVARWSVNTAAGSTSIIAQDTNELPIPGLQDTRIQITLSMMKLPELNIVPTILMSVHLFDTGRIIATELLR